MIEPGSAVRIAALEEAGAAHPTSAGEAQSTSTRVCSTSRVPSRVRTTRRGHIVSGARTMFVVIALFAAVMSVVSAEDAKLAVLDQSSLTNTPDGPKEQLRSIGIMPDVWVTQFYQGQTEGDGSKTWRHGGKLDAFLKVDAEKLGLWPGFHVNVQYEHYFGQNINRTDFALIPVNTALAYVERDGYHSALSVSVTQDLGEDISVSAGKFNMMTLASKTPLIGGGGIDTFMNRAFALPSTGVAYTALRGAAGDRVILSAPYLFGGIVTIKSEPFNFALMIADPRSAIDPRVIERPFEKGLAVGGRRLLKRRSPAFAVFTHCAPPTAMRAASISKTSPASPGHQRPAA
jgi:porin